METIEINTTVTLEKQALLNERQEKLELIARIQAQVVILDEQLALFPTE